MKQAAVSARFAAAPKKIEYHIQTSGRSRRAQEIQLIINRELSLNACPLAGLTHHRAAYG